MTDPRPTPPERVPVADLIREAREELDLLSQGHHLTHPRWAFNALAAALEATAAERDRAHATLRRIASIADPYVAKLARERLENP